MEFNDRSVRCVLGAMLAFSLLITLGATQTICNTAPCNLNCNSGGCEQSCTELPCTIKCNADSCIQRCVPGNCSELMCTAKDNCTQICSAGFCTKVVCDSKMCNVEVGPGSGPECKGDMCVGTVQGTGVFFKCDAKKSCNILCTNGGCKVEALFAETTAVDCRQNSCEVKCKKGSACSCSNNCAVTYNAASRPLVSQLGWISALMLISLPLI